MSWWGKVIGGTFGFMMGGPIGALLGAAFGHNFDRGLDGFAGQKGEFQNKQFRIQTAFFTATFSVMGHVCKADGQVTRDEISVANQVMGHMELNPEQKKAAKALFNEGKKSGFPLDDILLQLRSEIGHRLTLKRMFMEIQCLAALADGKVHPHEKKLLLHVCDVIGFSRYELDAVLAATRSSFQQPSTFTPADAYKILGISSRASDADVKKAYRRLMSQHHPDKLVSKGLPEEMVKVATEKTHEIRKAYETIKQHRDF
ncbi:MAG: co-chaperone DjlA [Gammaproteobacteria bacterium]|nr:co-chaperone DjlA [Gammaproteobacteria bacterium]